MVSFQAASADPEAALVRFEVTPGPNTVRVEWETAAELNTIGFGLYRSLETSPGEWGAALYAVAAHGDPVSGWTYSYTDTAVVPGTTYYYILDDLEVSPQGTLLVCPSATTTYLLTVVQTNGIKDYHRLAIYVGGDDAWFGVDDGVHREQRR